MEDIHTDLFLVDECVGRNRMHLNASKGQHLRIGSLTLHPLLLISDENGTHITLPLVSQAKDLAVMIGYS